MISRKLFVPISLVLIALVISACSVGPRAESAPGLSTDGESIYLANRSFIYKVGQNGAQIWHYPDKSSSSVVYYAAPVSSNGTVFFGDLANKFHAVSADTGLLQWDFSEAKGWFLAPANAESNLIIAPSLDRKVYALDEAGSLVWEHPSNFGFLAQPVITEERVIIASQEHEVFALDKQTGEWVWTTKTSGSMNASPYYDSASNTLFVGGLGHELIAIDETTGEIRWTFNNNSQMSAIWSTPIMIDNNLIVTDDNGVIYSVKPEDGSLNWSISTNEEMMAGPVALTNGFAVVSIAGNVRAYGLNQTPLWTLSLPDAKVYTSPVYVNDLIIIANKTTKNENLMFAVDQNGVQKWAFTPPSN